MQATTGTDGNSTVLSSSVAVAEQRSYCNLVKDSPSQCSSVLGCKWNTARLSSEHRSTMSCGGVKFYFAQLSSVNFGEFGQSQSWVSKSGPIMSACLCQIVYTWLHMCVCGVVDGG